MVVASQGPLAIQQLWDGWQEVHKQTNKNLRCGNRKGLLIMHFCAAWHGQALEVGVCIMLCELFTAAGTHQRRWLDSRAKWEPGG